jgi:hypothetical protein
LVSAHPIWSIFLLALLARVLVVIGIAIAQPHNIAPDGIEYSKLAAQQASGHTAAWGTYFHWLYERTGTLLVPITGLYELFGAHQVVGQLYVALLGAGVAAVAARLAMEVLPRRWALATGLIVALLPSQIVWSSLVLKDAAVWLTLAGLALTVAVAGRSRGWRLLALGGIAAALLVLLGYLRLQTLVVACWALMLAVLVGALVGSRVQRLPRLGAAVALGVLIPWLVFNLGPAGVTYVKNSEPPSQLRAGSSVGASSPISGTAPPTSSAAASADQSEVGADVRHLPQGVLALLAEPYPWQSGGSVYLNLARIQTVIWYPLLLLAFLGLLMLRPRHLRVMAFPLLAGGAILILYALTEGNLGTAFRHRGEFEWVIALLAGFGLWRLARWRASARGRVPEPEVRPG